MTGGLVFASLAQTPTPQPSPTPETRSVWDGVYTEKQAQRGEAVFHENCSTCHGNDLTGKPKEDIPPLTGDRFHDLWDDRTVGDLFKKISRTMPQDDPGRLNPQQAVDVVAFVLSFNKFPAGKDELVPEIPLLTAIRIEAKPKEKPEAAPPSR